MTTDKISVEEVDSPLQFYEEFVVGDSYCVVCDSVIPGVEDIEGNSSELVKAHLENRHGF